MRAPTHTAAAPARRVTASLWTMAADAATAGGAHRWLLPLSALVGACLLVGADLVGRVLVDSEQIDVGIITPFIGAPLFVWIVRRQKVREL